MRVLAVGNMYPPHHLGGYELVMQGAVRHLRSCGHQVRVLTSDLRLAQRERAAEDDFDVHRDLSWYWEDHAYPPRSFRQRLACERRSASVLAHHIGEFGPEAVTWWAMGGLSLSLLRRAAAAGLPSVAFVHDDWLLYAPEVDAWARMVAKRPWLRPVARLLTGSAPGFDPAVVSAWIFVSQTTRRHARERGWSLAETDVTPSGIDPSFLRHRTDATEWGGRLLYVGRLDERKGILTAAEALTLLPDCTLTVVGEGDDRVVAALVKRQRDLGLTGRLRLLGGRERHQLPAIYADADAVLFPVEWDEPWGLVPLEAMAIGRPVVATGRGGSGEYLRPEENSLLFEAGDAHALARAIERLAGDRGLRARLVGAGRALAPRFTEELLHARVLEAVQGLRGLGAPRVAEAERSRPPTSGYSPRSKP